MPEAPDATGAALHIGESHEHAGEPDGLVEVHTSAVPGRRGAVQCALSHGSGHRRLHEPAAGGADRGGGGPAAAGEPDAGHHGASVSPSVRDGVQPCAVRRAGGHPPGGAGAGRPGAGCGCAGAAAHAPERIAVIGSGPAGLACAYHLARLGYGVTVFDEAAEAGGMLRQGIPAYRLPRDVLDRQIRVVPGRRHRVPLRRADRG
jgi:hypothetical protein